jgi:MFS family permease
MDSRRHVASRRPAAAVKVYASTPYAAGGSAIGSGRAQNEDVGDDADDQHDPGSKKRAGEGGHGRSERPEKSADPIELGWLFSGFFWSYALLQIPTGMILDRFGVTWVYAIEIVDQPRPQQHADAPARPGDAEGRPLWSPGFQSLVVAGGARPSVSCCRSSS